MARGHHRRRGVVKEIDGKFQPGQEWQLEVTDEQQRRVYLIRVVAEKA
jgi:hypothetical protein